MPLLQQHSTTVVIAATAGGFLATVLRFSIVAVWPGPVAILVTTQVSTVLACLALGLLATSDATMPVRGAVGGFAGAAASLGGLTLLAVSAPPLLCLLYVTVTPASAATGLAAGVGIGLARLESADPR